MSILIDLERQFSVCRAATCVALAPIGSLVPAERRPAVLAGIAVPMAIAFDASHIAGLVVTGLAIYAIAHGLARVGGDRRRWHLAVGVIAVTCAVFLLGRMARLDDTAVPLFGQWRTPLFFLDMWLFLRTVTLFWEVGAGRPPLGPVPFVAWIALPFTMIGPLLRPGEFAASVGEAKRAPLDAAWARRIGVACAMMLAAIAIERWAIPRYRQPTWMRVGALFVAPWTFYLQFGGLYSLMSAAAAPWGLPLPESFERPFVRRNLHEFWLSWNSTVTRVARDYLFFARWGRKRPNPYLNTLIIFVAVGAWHDVGPFYLLWGAYHGLGYIVYLFVRAHRGSLARRAPRPPAPALTAASIAATYIFVVLSWSLPLFAIKAATRVAHAHTR